MDEFIGRINAGGTVDVYHVEDDEPATLVAIEGGCLSDTDGIVITIARAADIGLQIEGE